MTECLIAFNDEWVPEYTDEEFRRIGTATKALVAAMEAARRAHLHGRLG